MNAPHMLGVLFLIIPHVQRKSREGFDGFFSGKKSPLHSMENAFFALMLLCKDGARYEVLDEILARLVKKNRKELIAITRFFAGKVLTSEEDREQLERKFEVLREFLQDSWTFQETLEEGRVEGRIEEARQNIEAIVQVRFPGLRTYVKNLIASLTDREKLQKILLTVGTAQTKEEAEHSLRILQ